MIALVTGASSGIGRDLAINLSKMGYDLVLVSRDEKNLKKVANLCENKTEICPLDLSKVENCRKLFKMHDDVDILVNNAGFGTYGEFSTVNLETELNMIDLNIKAVHTLTKLYLTKMIEKNAGRILNVSSMAAFLPGPLMSTYYATKSYVFKLTTAVNEELKQKKSKVKVSVLCPGPVDTNFNNVAQVKFSINPVSSDYVAKYTIDKMFKNKMVIVPGIKSKLGVLGCKILPLRLLLKIDYNIQSRKEKNDEKEK
ncbi:MAG: SDR family NAD(P)-dependent oxidoreductase [Bacilli bacterium]|nr:SDR family NAD(P)-dependent oxidoreductase [Bacilli bacterium]